MSLKREKDENPFAPPIDEDFLQTALEYRDNFENEEDFQEALAIWPRCPQCGRRRVVKCSVCGTSGTLFQLGDREFWDFRSEEERARDVELIEEAERRQTALRDDHCCGECDCETDDAPESSLDGQLIPGARDWRRSPRRCGKRSNVFDDVPDARPRRAWAELGKNREDAPDDDADATPTAPTPELLVCHVCSEAFVPKFPRFCEWCDYDFKDSDDPEIAPNPETEAEIEEFVARKKATLDLIAEEDVVAGRVAWTIAAMGVAAAAAFAYFVYITR